jgi:hypothetical protein
MFAIETGAEWCNHGTDRRCPPEATVTAEANGMCDAPGALSNADLSIAQA